MSDKSARRDARVARVAARQHGVVTLAQLREAGVSRSTASGWAAAGRLHRIHRGVYAVGHSRLTPQGRCLAAVLACGRGSAVSHASAAFLWGMVRSLSLPVHVTIPNDNGRRSRSGLHVHSSLLLLDADVTTRDRIPLTVPTRTLRDLKRTAERDFYLSAARRAIDLHLIESPTGAADELTRSELERRFLALCRRHRLPLPEVNARVEGIEVDFLWRAQRLVVETDGFRFHADRAAFESDRARDVHLERLGYRVVRFTHRQVSEGSGSVAASLRSLLAAGVRPAGGPTPPAGR